METVKLFKLALIVFGGVGKHVMLRIKVACFECQVSGTIFHHFLTILCTWRHFFLFVLAFSDGSFTERGWLVGLTSVGVPSFQ